jgi:Heterokaryon incompatibility protein (HET)
MQRKFLLKSEEVASKNNVPAIMEYRTLDTDANEIRLLTLLPTDEAGHVCCTLKHVSLINPPEYVALSYCWGDASSTKEIMIDGIPLQVGSNLESALRHLLQHYTCLWADAICINQQDMAERSQQLLWMGSIYRRAERVAAWIGEEASDSNLAVDLIQNFHSHPMEVGSHERPLDTKYPSTAYSALLHLLDQPYWRRVW